MQSSVKNGNYKLSNGTIELYTLCKLQEFHDYHRLPIMRQVTIHIW